MNTTDEHRASEYCRRCDTDTHDCVGCGGNLGHEETCADCQAEIDRGER